MTTDGGQPGERQPRGYEMPGVRERALPEADAEVSLMCARRIRARRRALGLTQAQAAARLAAHGTRMSNQVLSAIENGRGVPAGRLPGLAAVLDCTVTYLLGLTADPHQWLPDAPTAPSPSPSRAPATARPAGQAPAPAATGRVHNNWILGPDPPPERDPLDKGNHGPSRSSRSPR